MLLHKKHQHLYLLLFILILHIHTTSSYIFIYAGCSQEKYQPGASPLFAQSINTFLSSASSSASQSSYNTFTSPPDSALFGLYQCRGDLKPSDCASCIQSAASQITLVCPYSYGASLQLEGCYVRYEHIDFLNKLDTTLVYKKCSKSNLESDGGFVQRRDELLEGLKGSVGFKGSRSGTVQGLAQCSGDLGQGDCGECLAQAVDQVKALCGSAAAAHVFLAKCYVQYWASGYSDIDPVQGNRIKMFIFYFSCTHF